MKKSDFKKNLKEARKRLRPEYPSPSINLADYETRQHAVVAIRERRLKRLLALNAPDIMIQNEKHLLQKEQAALPFTAKVLKTARERLRCPPDELLDVGKHMLSWLGILPPKQCCASGEPCSDCTCTETTDPEK